MPEEHSSAPPPQLPSRPSPQPSPEPQSQPSPQPQPQPSPQPQPQLPESSQPQSYPSTPVPEFDPSRMIGIIRRKALIKDLAAAYHAECLDYCQKLLELQRRWEETYKEIKTFEDSKKDYVRPSKRVKKVR
ncbi:tyrosine-protein phosphatase non-receptor type 23-like [Chenopodium quinoa]|uniref:tyrosine-protein phosphatase non-receptor type 23-like n=1 Tax=Chenopodium quinoa TaxID=63459 RepID=UPI000B78E114|nr:tyrosine-protein phosphatase non-receptor type 23-like [Chenopodium quinoa]